MTIRALDHVVWPTRDLNGLAQAWRDLGFTVGRRNRHPWGTLNHIVQFDGCFVELLGFAEDYRSASPKDPAFPFAGFCEAFLQSHHAGAAMLVLRSHDAAVDARTFQANGLGQGRTLPFAREAQRPDGGDASVAFTIAFADLPGLPEVGAFTCQQHRPENFWNPALQHHANGASGLAGLGVEGPAPDSYGSALRQFTSSPPRGHNLDLTLDGSTRIEIRRGHAPAGITHVTMKVPDIEAMLGRIAALAVPHSSSEDGLAVMPTALGRTAIRFVE